MVIIDKFNFKKLITILGYKKSIKAEPKPDEDKNKETEEETTIQNYSEITSDESGYMLQFLSRNEFESNFDLNASEGSYCDSDFSNSGSFMDMLMDTENQIVAHLYALWKNT